MNTLFRNFSHTFRRFFTASVLNLLGLSIAFAACFVILTQVDYDYNYNKAYPAHDRIYRVEVDAGGDYGWQIWLARPFCELVGASSPHIQAISVTSLSNSLNDFEVDEHIYSEPWFTGFGDYLEVFQPTMVCGTTASLNEPGHALISASMARRFFGTTDAIGKTIYVDRKSRNQPLVVGGVYQDMPENSQLGNCVFSSYSPNLNKDSWRNWNYALYIRLDSPASLTDVERSVIESCKLNIPRDLISGEGEEDWEQQGRRVPAAVCIGADSAYSSSQLHELLTGRNSHAVTFHQYPKGVGGFHFLLADVSAVRIRIGLCVWLPVVLALALSVARHLPEYLGGIRPLFDESSEPTDSFGRNGRVHGLAGWSLSFLLRHLFSAGTGTERLVRSFPERKDVAYVSGLLPVLCLFHADYLRGHHVPAEPLYSAERLWL